MLPSDIRRAFRLDLGRRRAREAELDDEIRFHLEQRIADLVAQGWSPERARVEAIARFGPFDESRNQLLEAARSRDEVLTMFDRFAALRSVPADLRYALRRMRSRFAFTLIALVSLGLGIGANTAVFSLINAILLHKTPLPQPDRVVELYAEQDGKPVGPMSYPDYVDLRAQAKGVFKYVAISKLSMISRDMGDHVQSEMAELVNGDYFALLGLRPEAGRLLGPEDDVAKGEHPVVVLSSDYWHRAFNADPSVVGREIRLSGRPYTIVGVASKDLQGLVPGLAPAMFAPALMANQLEPTIGDGLARRGNHSYFAKARLVDGQSVGAARAVVDRFVTDMRARYPDDWTADMSLGVIPFENIAVNPLIDGVVVPAASALMVVVALVLIVACANLASFLLAQSRDRQREIAIRLAIGATRGAIVRQLLTESLVLSLAGGALGLAVGTMALGALLHADLPIPIPLNLNAGLDLRVLAFALVMSLAAGLLFGLLPALQTTKPRVVDAMRADTAAGRPGRRVNLRNALVVAQTAISVVLLVAAGLFLRSFAAQANIDPGFGAKPAGLVWMAIPPDKYPGERSAAMLTEIERRVRGLADVDAVGVIDNLMLNALNRNSKYINVAGFEAPKGQPGFDVASANADSGFFDAVGVPLIAGRGFLSTDTRGAPRVAVINQFMANRFWPGRSAIGQTFRGDTTVYRVVGVVRNTKVNSLGEPPQSQIFFAFTQATAPDFMLVARTRGNAEQTTQRMLATLHEVDPSLMVLQAKTMTRHLAAMMLPARLGAAAFAVFAALALVLALIGVYGVVRYSVARRTREVAIRLAVGAAPRSVVRLLMAEGLWLVGIGAVVGLTLGLAMARALEALLYGVSGVEPLSMFGAPALLFGVGALAAFLPARRASRVDAAITLRTE